VHYLVNPHTKLKLNKIRFGTERERRPSDRRPGVDLKSTSGRTKVLVKSIRGLEMTGAPVTTEHLRLLQRLLQAEEPAYEAFLTLHASSKNPPIY